MRPPRLHYPGIYEHVIIRGVGGMTLFRDSRDHIAFRGYLLDVKREHPFYLFAECEMSNHVHLLIQVLETPTWIFMQKLLTRYAKRFNLKYGWTGHVFQDRYKAILCERDPYFKELLRYIHLNPVRANLVSDPKDWPWSGHHAYLNLNSPSELIDRDFALSLFSIDKARQQENLLRFVQDGLLMGHRKDLYPPASRPYLGSRSFVESFV